MADGTEEQPIFLTEPFDVSGKNVLITGAAKGIGFAIARQFLNAGANVVLNDLDGNGLEAALRIFGKKESSLFGCCGDVADRSFVRRLVDDTVQKLGSLDILINNAGIYSPTPLDRLNSETVDRLFDVNVKGLLYLSAEAARVMQPGSSIIHISSLGGLRPPFPGLAVYHATKGAIDSLTRDMAIELAPKGIRVNSAAPGGITTEGNVQVQDSSLFDTDKLAEITARAQARPVGRMGYAQDLSPVVLFLASPAARFITGQMILVDGGYYYV